MTISQLGLILQEMYNKAPQGYQVANIHFFGVKYADVIIRNDYSATDIIRAAGLRPSYSTEVSKGIKLSKYVVPRSKYN